MAKKPRVIVINENETQRNIKFLDQKTKEEMTRTQFVKKIEKGCYPDYVVKVINDLKTPVSKPDGDTGNNLG